MATDIRVGDAVFKNVTGVEFNGQTYTDVTVDGVNYNIDTTEGSGSSGGGVDLNQVHTFRIRNEGPSTIYYGVDSAGGYLGRHIIDTPKISLSRGQTTEYLTASYLFLRKLEGGTGYPEISSGSYIKLFHYFATGGIYLITADGDLLIYCSCFLPDTMITLADGTRKTVKDITYDDRLLVWNFDEGELDTAPICWLTKSGLHNDHYYKLTFSDGSVLKTTGVNSNHKIYNMTERFFKGVDKTEVGDIIYSENGPVTVTAKEYIEEDIEYYNLITSGNICCFAEGILASDRYGNMYPIDETMKYIKEGREIRPYSEFEAKGIKRYWYDHLRLGEVTDSVDKVFDYVQKCECQMREIERIG